jgi:LysR family tcuABC transcriptional regulator
MLNARQLDLAVLFDTGVARRWSVMPLLEEKLYLMRPRLAGAADAAAFTSMAQLDGVPLILPTGAHGLRSTLDAAFAQAGFKPQLVAEVDSLTMLMDAVCAGLGSTVQPWAALGRVHNPVQCLQWAEITDTQVHRSNALCSLSDDELSPAALATRVVLADCARTLVRSGAWQGTGLIHHDL